MTRKTILILIGAIGLLAGCQPSEQCELKCSRKAIRDVQVCETEPGAIVGGIVGFMFAGPIGAGVGAIAGHAGSNKKCYQQKEEYCVDWNTVCTGGKK